MTVINSSDVVIIPPFSGALLRYNSALLSPQVIPPPKARTFTGDSFDGETASRFRAMLMGHGGERFPCLANRQLAVRGSAYGGVGGRGLFAGVPFVKGAVVAVYGGRFVSSEECEAHGSHAVALAEVLLRTNAHVGAYVCMHIVDAHARPTLCTYVMRYTRDVPGI